MPDGLAAEVDAVRRLGIVRSILQIVTSATGMRFAAVVRVTGTRWVACEVIDGIGVGVGSGEEIPLEQTLCRYVRDLRSEVVVDDVAADPLYAAHPAAAIFGFRSYVSVPIVLDDGEFFGTLCAFDPEPRPLETTSASQMFRRFAELLAFHLSADRHWMASREDLILSQAALAMSLEKTRTSEMSLASSRTALSDVTTAGELREQFIAVLGHDLRNPLASIDAGLRILGRGETNSDRTRVLHQLDVSARRMNALIDDMLDLARGRLGGGIGVERVATISLEPLLMGVIAETRLSHPQREIDVRLSLDRPVPVDGMRIAQMFSNLLANAVVHGAPDEPVTVSAFVSEGAIEIAVANGGPMLAPEMLESLFQPFRRGGTTSDRRGLGLGLYIAQEIARAHGGTITPHSDERRTRFVFHMPLEPA